jgi:Integrase zinc binding domain
LKTILKVEGTSMNDKDYEDIIKNIDQENDYEINHDILYRMKDNEKLRVIRRYEFEGVLLLMHDHPTAAHFGIESTYNRIKEKYWWKGMRKDIEAYVKTCK